MSACGQFASCPHAGGQRDRPHLAWSPGPGRYDPPTIIITALTGTTLSRAQLPSPAERDVHEQAGALLAAFHAAPAPASTTNMPAWLAARGEQWLALAADLLDRRQQAQIRAHLQALADLGHLPTTPCHLDSTPGNLLCDDDGQVN